MRRIIVISPHSSLNDGAFLNSSTPELHRDVYRRDILLVEEFQKRGYNVIFGGVTTKPNANDILVALDQPCDRVHLKFLRRFPGQKFLIINETPVIHPWNDFNGLDFRVWRKIFSWSESPTNIPNHVHVLYLAPNFGDYISKSADYFAVYEEICLRRRLVYIASNRVASHPQELFSFRRKLIMDFDKLMPSSFDLYGRYWDVGLFDPQAIGARILNSTAFLRTFRRRPRPSCWKGILPPGKKDIISTGSIFNLCIENSIGYPGYVTEKIFDALIGGFIPVYYGTDRTSLERYLPEDLYIDIRKFSSLRELTSYLTEMSSVELYGYLYRIRRYIESRIEEPTSANVSKFIADEIDHA